MIFSGFVTIFCLAVALSWASRTRPSSLRLLRLSGVMLTVALSLLGYALPAVHHLGVGRL